jgi:hypothetical protein
MSPSLPSSLRYAADLTDPGFQFTDPNSGTIISQTQPLILWHQDRRPILAGSANNTVSIPYTGRDVVEKN